MNAAKCLFSQLNALWENKLNLFGCAGLELSPKGGGGGGNSAKTQGIPLLFSYGARKLKDSSAGKGGSNLGDLGRL